jgi:hypothetical protein
VRPKGNKLVKILLAVALVLVIVAAAALAGPDPISQPVLDGCTRDRGAIFTHDVPNWVYVNDKDYLANGPSPPEQWAHGVAESAYDPERSAHPTGVDDPFTHTSYDFIFNLDVPLEQGLLAGSAAEGTGNYAGKDEETARLHTERETATFPAWAWPTKGDYVALRGNWVWDCDHAGPTGERTEIHPFHTLFVWRHPGGPSPNSPYGESEGDIFITGASTPADRQAECAHKTKGDRIAFKACVAVPGAHLDIRDNYEFFLQAPPRPSKSAKLAYRIVDKGSANAPRLHVKPAGRVGIFISFMVGGAAARVAKQVFLGWRPMPAKKLPIHLQARFQELLVRRAMDPGCPLDKPKCKDRNETTRVGQYSKSPGEWNVYTDVAGVWSQWPLVRPRDGQRIKTSRKVDFYVPPGKPWRLFVQTRECDFGSVGNAYSASETVWPCPRANEIGNPIGDDEPGILVDHFRSPTTGLGMHSTNSRLDRSTCPKSNKHGCYALTYSVRRISSPHR